MITGTVNINGNPTLESGDIDLSLRERDAPVQVYILKTTNNFKNDFLFNNIFFNRSHQEQKI